jgi:hypothetical protein
MVTAALRTTGVQPSAFSGVSCRMGCLAVATAAGVPEPIMWMQSGHAQSMAVRRYVRLTDPDRLYVSRTTTIDSSPCRPPCPLPSNGMDHRPGAAGRARDDASSSMPASPTSASTPGGYGTSPTPDPAALLDACDIILAGDIADAHHLSIFAGAPENHSGHAYSPSTSTVKVVRRWLLVMGCDPSTCLGLCDKAMSSFCIDGSVGRFATAHFRQRDAGSPRTR